MTEQHAAGRARCVALVGKRFATPRGKVGEFVGVLERPDGRPPVAVGKLLGGQIMHYTPSKAEGLVIS